MDEAVQRGQHHGEISRIAGDAMFRRAEDGEVAGVATDRAASASARALVAREMTVAEIEAPCALQEVSADGRHVAKLARRPRQHGVREHGVAAPDGQVRGQVAVAHAGADTQPAAGDLFLVPDRTVRIK